jgi:hypothetical protein
MKKKRKSSRKFNLMRNRQRKLTASYGLLITRTGDIVPNPLNRKAYKIETAKLTRGDGQTTAQHQKEVRKQRLTKARRALSKVQAQSRKVNRELANGR